ncbi:AhpC/TSA family protein [Chitinophaga horti]|uniref:AhpC/TSA family protein n=1 Tax=Chitinophaga horti TaxID=2920382 RepID=A0ABY6J5I3_9BACT|nr:TlpA disulfide reductase family protein [Chitinophaga horti]UYQ93847.1 AhpC/TSA family protein [Chitinophaga horti]
MKNLFLFVVLLACAAGANAQQTISGSFKGANGKVLYLFDDTADGPQDSVVIKEEKFRFAIKNNPEAEIYALIYPGVSTPLFMAPGKDALQFELDTAHFPLANDMKVNEATKYMQMYQRNFKSFSNKAAKLNAEAAGIAENDEAAKQAFRKKAEEFNTGVIAAGRDFITQNPGQLASLWMLGNDLANRLSPSDVEALYKSLTPEVRKSKHAERIENYLQSVKQSALNVTADDFTQNDTKGKPVKLSSFRGKYVLVDFWASWCGPCRQENPNVVAAYNKYKDKNFTILGVSLDDDRADWLKAIEADKLQWTQVSDLGGWNNKVAKQYGIRSIPANFLVDPQGKIVARNLRGEQLEATLAELLH